ncbi:MAG: hypothetical protein ACI8QZ_002608 [Chlamydiales bacterium]|jgi:hypothetical protein
MPTREKCRQKPNRRRSRPVVAFGPRLHELFGLVSITLLMAACQGTGRIMADDEADLVGNESAGAAAYNKILTDGIAKLLTSHSAQSEGSQPVTVAVMGIENQGSEELGDWGAQLYELIATSINESPRYQTINRRMIDRALSASNLRQDDLFLPAGRRQFLETLETDENPVQVLLFPSISTGTTTSGRTSQRDTILKLDLVDMVTGWDEQFTSKVSKEYQKSLF